MEIKVEKLEKGMAANEDKATRVRVKNEGE